MPKSKKKAKGLEQSRKENILEKDLEYKEEIEDLEDQDIEESDHGKIFAIWEFPEFIKHEKSKWWYLSFVVVFLAMLTYAYFDKNLLFAIILAIFAVLYLSSAKDDPVTMETAITEDGIFIGSKFIPYEDFQNFYIIYHPPEIKNLYFEPKNMLRHRITIPLEDQNPVHIREVLLEYLDEDIEKEEIPASEGISNILKL